MILPRPWALKWGMIDRQGSSTPYRLTSSVRFHSSKSTDSVGPMGP